MRKPNWALELVDKNALQKKIMGIVKPVQVEKKIGCLIARIVKSVTEEMTNAFIEYETARIEETEKHIKVLIKDSPFIKKDIEYLGLSTRAIKYLHLAGITKIKQLIACTELDLMEQECFGKKTLEDVKTKLAQVGLSLKRFY